MFGKIIQDEAATVGRKQLAGLNLLDRIIKLSQDSVTSIREIIWAIDPKLETLHDLLMRVYDFATNICRGGGINLKFDVPARDQLPPKNLSPEYRKQLWLLLKEAINNAFKHSGCSELSIQARFKTETICIKINDNGCGFDYPDHSTKFSGKGLGTMKSRVEQLSGSYAIHSKANEGTSIVITVKI
jgi:signal transduction histidine kinase